MLRWGEAVRLARKLLKTVVVLAVAAAALGGAAALGSSLFERPPRAAAEFAARAGGAGAAATPAGANERRPGARAKRRYVRALEASCRQQLEDVEALGRPGTLAEVETYLERVLALARHYQGESLGVKTPPALRDDERRSEALGEEGIDLLEQMLAAARRGEPDTLSLLAAALIELGEKQNELFRRLGARDCVVETPVAAY